MVLRIQDSGNVVAGFDTTQSEEPGRGSEIVKETEASELFGLLRSLLPRCTGRGREDDKMHGSSTRMTGKFSTTDR